MDIYYALENLQDKYGQINKFRKKNTFILGCTTDNTSITPNF